MHTVNKSGHTNLLEKETLTIGIIGLGLIGGSMAKLLNEIENISVYGSDISEEVLARAKMLGSIEGKLTDDILKNCDMVLIALYPKLTVQKITEIAPLIGPDTIVVDCCGIKSNICNNIDPVAKKYGFTFIGGHPMDGIEHSGFNYSKKQLFIGKSMILTPISGTPIQIIDAVKKFFLSVGFGNISIETPENHDRIIAYTSQLAHIVSSAYIKSPTAPEHKGFSAGSYKDMTRVAKLNENMWTELFLQNKDNLLFEVDQIIDQLTKYKAALENENSKELCHLLKDGRVIKEEIDKEKF